MCHTIQIWLTGFGMTMVIASAPGPVQAQAGQPGLHIVGPAITKQSTQRTIATVRSGMKEGSAFSAMGGAKNAAKAGDKSRRNLDVKPEIVRGK